MSPQEETVAANQDPGTRTHPLAPTRATALHSSAPETDVDSGEDQMDLATADSSCSLDEQRTIQRDDLRGTGDRVLRQTSGAYVVPGTFSVLFWPLAELVKREPQKVPRESVPAAPSHDFR